MTAGEPFPHALIAGHACRSPVELAIFLREQCGAEGYRISGNMILALRWDLQGNEITIDRFSYSVVD